MPIFRYSGYRSGEVRNNPTPNPLPLEGEGAGGGIGKRYMPLWIHENLIDKDFFTFS
jgi:hypothetical protein